jgi:hypothetical protein
MHAVASVEGPHAVPVGMDVGTLGIKCMLAWLAEFGWVRRGSLIAAWAAVRTV